MATKDYADNAAKSAGEITRSRKSKSYVGKEDDSVSGRAALDKYSTAAKSNDVSRMDENYPPVSKSGAEAAQATQRETMNERRRETKDRVPEEFLKRGGRVKKMAKGGSVDGIAQRGKTRGRYI